MSVVQLAVPDTGSNLTLADRLVDQLADRIGGLGMELADIAGNVQEVAGRVANQSERFHHLQTTAVAGARGGVSQSRQNLENNPTHSRNARRRGEALLITGNKI
jgi:hypothetical protein